MGDAGGPGRQRVRHRRHAPVVDPPGSQTWAGPAARAPYGRSPLAPPSAARVPAFVPSRASPRCGHGLCVRSPSAPRTFSCGGHRRTRPRNVRAVTVRATTFRALVTPVGSPPGASGIRPRRRGRPFPRRRSAGLAGPDTPSRRRRARLAGPDTPSPAEGCLPDRSGHPIPRRRGACLDRPAQQLSVGPGRSSLITCRTCRKVSKLRGESLPCRQPGTATCPIGSVLLPSSRPLAGAPRTGDIFCPWADVPLAPPRRVSGPAAQASRPCRGRSMSPPRDRPAPSSEHWTVTRHLGRFRSTPRPQPKAPRGVDNPSLAPTIHVPFPTIAEGRARPPGGVASTAPLRPPARGRLGVPRTVHASRRWRALTRAVDRNVPDRTGFGPSFVIP